MRNKKYIVYLGFGCRGFPYGLAEIQKIILISKSQIEVGNSVTVISTKGMHRMADHPDMKESGNFEGIDYVYTSGNPFWSDSFLERNLLKVKGMVNEFLLLKKLKKQNKLDCAILSTHTFYLIFYYVIVSKVLHFKTILNYVEFVSGIKKEWYKIRLWLNDKLLDRFSPRLTDGIFVISEFLINHLRKIAPEKKYLKIPNLVDCERYKNIEIIRTNKYFLFCGATGYMEVIEFIIDSFNRLNQESVDLYLVINGPVVDFAKITNYINNTPNKDRIKIFSNLTQNQLYSFYKNAIGLLIPLRPVIQDIARFPHKVGEYLASGNPVISTNYGEIKCYFQDMKDMLIAGTYDIDMFADKMQFVIDHPEEAQKIGLKGKQMGLNNFDYRNNATKINDFINSILA
jgi:glycosyltransferase involved in cell wall biosynthesis